MDATWAKYDEAAFFLNKLEDARGSAAFQYYLSAFLSAGRSITWVLDKEYKHSAVGSTFIDWYGDTETETFPPGTKGHELRDNDLCQFMGAQRNIILKEGHGNPADLSDSVTLVTTSEEPISMPSPRQPDSPIMVRFIVSTETEPEPRYYFAGEDVPESIASQSICALATTYLSRLADVLTEWEEILETIA